MNKLFILSFIVLAASCNNNEQTKFEVEGQIKNAGDATIYLEETPTGNEQAVILDSAKLGKDGKFELSTLAKEESIYNLRLASNPYPFVSLINDNDEIEVTADVNAPDAYTVKGSPASEALRDYLFASSSKLRGIYTNNMAIDSMQQAQVSDSIINIRRSEQAKTAGELKQYTNDVINKSNSPSLSLYVLGTYQSMASNQAFGIEPFTEAELVGTISKLAQKYPDHQALATINQSFQQQQQQAAAAPASWVNKPAPDFTLPDVDGKPVSLSSFKGKYVLVDFWASWCGPCRAENPTVVEAYQKFNNKNFTVLGVSLDRPGQKDDWVKAIKKDNLTWTHVSDLKFWNSEVVGLYGIEGIPFNVLVNPQGVVVAENLRGEELLNKLNEVL